MIVIYHNSSCSKSRASLEIIKEKGEPFEILNYLETPPSFAELRSLLMKLGLPASRIIRTGEEDFKENYSDLDLDDGEAVISAIVKFPRLLERPIIVRGDKAIIGRPPEDILKLWS